MQNHLLLGTADKADRITELLEPPFLLIDDGPVIDAALERFPKSNRPEPTGRPRG